MTPWSPPVLPGTPSATHGTPAETLWILPDSYRDTKVTSRDTWDTSGTPAETTRDTSGHSWTSPETPKTPPEFPMSLSLQCLSSQYSIPNGPNSRTLISSFFFISSIYCYRTTYTRTLLAKSLMPIGKFFRHTIHLSLPFKNIIGRVSKMVFLNLLQARPKISKWRTFEACKLSLLER